MDTKKLNGVAAIGQLTVDCVFAGFRRFPKLGEEELADTFTMQLGGGAVVIPVLSARFGIPARFGTFLGKDRLSGLALELLKEQGYYGPVNLYTGEGTPVVITAVCTFPEDRCFLSYNEEITEDSLSADEIYRFLKGSRVAFAPKNETAAKMLKKDGTVLVFDVNWEEDLNADKYRELLAIVDYFVPNEKEAYRMTGASTREEALTALKEMTECPVIKLGKEGCMTYDGGRIVTVGPAGPFQTVDTTGAGDNFAAGFVYGLHEGYDLQDCLRIGNIMGGLSTEGYGCFSAGICREKVLSLLDGMKLAEGQ